MKRQILHKIINSNESNDFITTQSHRETMNKFIRSPKPAIFLSLSQNHYNENDSLEHLSSNSSSNSISESSQSPVSSKLKSEQHRNFTLSLNKHPFKANLSDSQSEQQNVSNNVSSSKHDSHLIANDNNTPNTNCLSPATFKYNNGHNNQHQGWSTSSSAQKD